MAYSSMEFSSGLTDRVADDDIDIDIDLLPAQNDEDYIIEDVHSDGGHEEATVSNDDLMIDDENASYQMDDIDVFHEGNTDNLQMEDADTSEMRASDIAGDGASVNGGERLTSLKPNDIKTSEAALDYSLKDQGIGDDAEEVNEFDEAEIGGEEDSKIIAISPPTSLSVDGFKSEVAHHPEATLSEKKSIPQTIAGKQIQERLEPILDFQETVAGDQGPHDFESSSDIYDEATNDSHTIMVIYRDAEYSLISKSDLDDPDSFFLKDGKLINAPLDEFLAALREVIQDDLASDEELCLAIEDLGLEISETCMYTHGVTLFNILDLYQNLLRNDGAHSPRPICIMLSTKTDFAKRLAGLAAGAGEGKGLSELVAWDEESEIPEDTSEDDHPEDKDSKFEEHDRPYEASGSTVLEGEMLEKIAAGEQIPENMSSRPKVLVNDDEAVPEEDINEVSDVKKKLGNGTLDHGVPFSDQDETEAHGLNVLTDLRDLKSHPEADEIDEDGDLIDYEDEEYEKVQDTSRSATLTQKTDSIRAQDALDEKLSQSLIPSTSDQEETRNHQKGVLDVNSEHSPMSGEEIILERPYHDEGEHIEQETTSYDPYVDQEDDVGSDEELENGISTHDAVEFRILSDEAPQEEAAENGVVIVDNIGTEAEIDTGALNRDIENRLDDEDLDEIDYDLRDQEIGLQETSYHTSSGVKSAHSGEVIASTGDQDEDEISYEEDEVAGSNQSDHTLVASDTPNPEDSRNMQLPDDEINYDTTEQQPFSGPPEAEVAYGNSPKGYSGKRQRADTHDTAQESPKQIKRARS